MNIEQVLKKPKKKKAKTEKKQKNEKSKTTVPKPKKKKIKETVKLANTNRPTRICTSITNNEKIKEILNSSTLSENEILLSQKQIQNPINENKFESVKNSVCSLRRDKMLNKSLLAEYNKRKELKSTLPILEKREEILRLISENSVVVVHGEPGNGKTTLIPQFILDHFMKNGKGSICKIVSTQPYKKYVLDAFKKVSEERREVFGNSHGVNYQIRFDKSTSRDTGSITFCTSGILLKKMSSSSYLNQITHLIIDEIQKRDSYIDFLLAFMKQVISKRTNLKLILICTSVIAKKISKYFDNCKKINTSPELYPIKEYYLEDVLIFTNFNNLMQGERYNKNSLQENESKYPIAITNFAKTIEKQRQINYVLLVATLKYICVEYTNGNILILLPTISSINTLKTMIDKDTSLNSKTQIVTLLHFELPGKDNEFNTNRKIFLTPDENYVDLNTSNIVFVIDSGILQINFHDIMTNTEILQSDWISQKTAKQRKNLAGRKNPGICFHLFSKDKENEFDKYPIPKIMSTDFENIVLEIKNFGIKNTEIFLKSFLTPPDMQCAHKTIEKLKINKILTDKEFLTPLGVHIVKLPLNFAVGKMVILGTLFSCLGPILSIAAYFSFRNIFIGTDYNIQKIKKQVPNAYSDILLFLDFLIEFKKTKDISERDFYTKYSIPPSVFKEVDNIIQQLADRLFEMHFLPSREYSNQRYNINSKNINLINSLISVALYPNIAIVRNHDVRLKNKPIQTISQKTVKIHITSINSNKSLLPTPLLMYRTLCQSKDDVIKQTSSVTPLQAIFFAADVKYSPENEYSVITAADSLKIYCSNSTCSIIKLVQEKFNFWFEYKMRNPGYVDWEKNSWDTSTLRAVLELLNNEEKIDDISISEPTMMIPALMSLQL